MAIFRIIEGQPGQGKSLWTAKKCIELLERNKKWYEKQVTAIEKSLKKAHGVEHTRPIRRLVASNMRFSKAVEDKWGVFPENKEGYIFYWAKLEELHNLRDADILWDEIATELDSRNWPNLTPETMRMLSQYRKRGLDIYANTQDFSMVDARARLMITRVDTLRKIIGSPDPSATKPVINKIWGLILVRGVENWKETQAEKKKYSIFNWSIFFIEREHIELYDTRQDIKHGGYPPLTKIVRVCPDDGYTRTTYI